MEGCTLDFSNMPEIQFGADINVASSDARFESFGGVVRNNTFTDFQGWYCLEVAYCNSGAKSYGHKAEGNTFIRCDCPILCSGSWDGTIISDCLIANNNIIDHDQAPKSPTFWTTPIWWWNNDVGPSGSPGIWVDSAQNVSVVNNNFTQSGILPDQAWYLSAIWLDLCSNCFVNQSNSTFPQDLSVEHWVVDTNGSGNTLNGVVSASAGAPQAVASSSEMRKKMHDQMMRRNTQRHKRSL